MNLRNISLSILAAVTLVSCRSNPSSPTTTPTGTWGYSSSGTSNNLIIGQFLNSSVGFAAGITGVIVKTTDDGNTWTNEGNAPVFSGSMTGSIYGISFLNSTTGFVAGDQRDISKTTDGGQSWAQLDASAIDQTELIRSVAFTTANTGYIGTTDAYAAPSGSIYQTLDGGMTWNTVFSANGGIYTIDFAPGSHNGVALGRFGVAYWTSDGGNTWNAGTSDQPNGIIYRATFTSATTGFAAAQSLDDNVHGYILRTDDAGHTWKTIQTVNEALGGIDNNGNGTITAAGYGGMIVESTDGGTTWANSTAGSGRWIDVRYADQHNALLFGENGNIAHRTE
ncbi:MAG TPA: YCF48-related protein [Candidatus Kapabacteria bacterium]|jgi:photosystem II stability/assembly factor-like uncharacterized protein